MKRLLTPLTLLLLLSAPSPAQDAPGQRHRPPASSDPSTGVTGDCYWNTSSSLWKCYNGSAYVAAGFSGSYSSFTATGSGGAGYVELPEQASAPGTPTNAVRFFVDSANRFNWKGENGFTRAFDGTGNTANRVYTLPDADSKLPVFSQVVTFSGPTAARTVTLPDANFTAARTDAGQTFAGNNVFSGSVDATSYKLSGTTVIDSAAWTTYTPTVTSFSGTFTSVSATIYYRVIGKTCLIRGYVTITNNGTATGYIKLTMPVAPSSTTSSQAGAGRIEETSQVVTAGFNTEPAVYLHLYDGTYPGATGRHIAFNAVIELN